MLTALSSFFDAHFIEIYFIYGLAFFSMGLALWVESRRTSQLRLARAVRVLSVFGLLHSAHEFSEMFGMIQGHPLDIRAHTVQAVLLAASFVPLIAFGVELLPRAERTPGFSTRMSILAVVGFMMAVVLVRVTYRPTDIDWILAIHALARYMLGMPAATLAALGLMRQRRALQERNMTQFASDLGLAAIAMTWYGVVGQAFPKESLIFPSMYINAENFRDWFGIPIQVLRAVMAITTAIAMIRALRAFDEENRRQIAEAQVVEHELKTAARELSLLYEASHLLTASHDLNQMLQQAIDRIVHVIEPIKRGVIFVPYLPETGSVHHAFCGYSESEVQELSVVLNGTLDKGKACWCAPSGDDVTDKILASLSRPSSASAHIAIQRLVLPLETNQRLLGSVLLETAPEGPYLSSLEAPTIMALGRQLAIAIENVKLVLVLREREARRAELLQRATAAQEAERKRIARELHDETGQALTALALGLKGMEKLVRRNPEKASEQFAQLQGISTTALEELRHLISDLRPSHLDVLGLVAALRWYTEQVAQRQDIKVNLRVCGEAYRLTPELETTLFRIAQESLTNVIKHAGAYSAGISLEFKPTTVEMEIQDDGRGFDTAHILKPGAGRAWGLIGIQERVELAGGQVCISSSPGTGTVIRVNVPALRPAADSEMERQETYASD